MADSPEGKRGGGGEGVEGGREATRRRKKNGIMPIARPPLPPSLGLTRKV